MHTETHKIKGMHCASCASIIEKTFKKVDGVHSVEVNYGTESAKISYDDTKINLEQLSKKIEPLGYSFTASKSQSATMMGMSESEHAEHLGLNQSKSEKLAEIASMRTMVLSAIPISVISAFILTWEILAQFGTAPEMSTFWEEFFHHLLPLMATYVLFVVGKPYLLGFYRFIRYGKANME